jgi:hypothetical protein
MLRRLLLKRLEVPKAFRSIYIQRAMNACKSHDQSDCHVGVRKALLAGSVGDTGCREEFTALPLTIYACAIKGIMGTDASASDACAMEDREELCRNASWISSRD